MILAQGRQGESVTYSVASSNEALFFAAYSIAFSSACIAREQLPFRSRAHPVTGHSSSQLLVPDGGPLYPNEMILVSLHKTAPTLIFTQCDLLARFCARSI